MPGVPDRRRCRGFGSARRSRGRLTAPGACLPSSGRGEPSREARGDHVGEANKPGRLSSARVGRRPMCRSRAHCASAGRIG